MCLRNIYTKCILHPRRAADQELPTAQLRPAVAYTTGVASTEPARQDSRAHWSVHVGWHACPFSMPIDASLCLLPLWPQICRFCLAWKWAAPETRRRPANNWLGVTVGIAVCDATLRRDADHRLLFHADMNEKSFAADNSDEFYTVTQQTANPLPPAGREDISWLFGPYTLNGMRALSVCQSMRLCVYCLCGRKFVASASPGSGQRPKLVVAQPIGSGLRLVLRFVTPRWAAMPTIDYYSMQI